VSPTSITVRVPLTIRRRPGRKTIVTPTGEHAAIVQTRADPALLKALARAFRWQKLLDDGRYASISELAAAEKIERGYLGKMLQLTLLAPWVVQAIVDGRQGADVSLPGLMGGGAQRVGQVGRVWVSTELSWWKWPKGDSPA
jgi:hypothetical protein